MRAGTRAAPATMPLRRGFLMPAPCPGALGFATRQFVLDGPAHPSRCTCHLREQLPAQLQLQLRPRLRLLRAVTLRISVPTKLRNEMPQHATAVSAKSRPPRGARAIRRPRRPRLPPSHPGVASALPRRHKSCSDSQTGPTTQPLTQAAPARFAPSSDRAASAPKPATGAAHPGRRGGGRRSAGRSASRRWCCRSARWPPAVRSCCTAG